MSKNPIKGYNKYKLRIIMSKNPIKGYNKEDMNEKYPKKKNDSVYSSFCSSITNFKAT